MTIVSSPRLTPGVPAPEPGASASEPSPGAPKVAHRHWSATVAPVAGTGVVLFGVIARFWATSPLWLDEAISVNIARLPISQIGPALVHDGHPPLYYVLLHVWMAVFGPSNLAVRSLSGLISVAALPLIGAAGRRLGGRWVALVAVVLLASSPFAIRYATEARMYALLTFLVLAGYLAVVRALEWPNLGRLVLVAALTTAVLFTHYWGAWSVASGAALVVGLGWVRPAQRRTAVLVTGALVAGGLPFLVWLPSAAQQAAHTGTPWARSVEPFDATFDLLLDLGGGKWAGGRVLGPLLAVFVLVAILARPVDRWRLDVDLRTVAGARPEVAVAAITLVLGLGAAVATSSAFQPRYAAGAVPFVLLAAALGIVRLPNRTVRGVLLALVVVVGGAGAVREATGRRTQADQVAEQLRAVAAPGDVVGFCPDQLRPAVQRAWGNQRALDAFTFPGGSPPGRIDWVDYPERIRAGNPKAFAARLLARAGTTHSVWLVSSAGYRGFGTDCEAIQTALEHARGIVDPAVERDASSYEHDVLRRYPPP